MRSRTSWEGPPPDPAWFKCWFCRKTSKQVRTRYGAEFPVRDPNTFAIITLIFERYSQWGFVDAELFQCRHCADHLREPRQRPAIAAAHNPPLLEQGDGALHRRPSTGVGA